MNVSVQKRHRRAAGGPAASRVGAVTLGETLAATLAATSVAFLAMALIGPAAAQVAPATDAAAAATPYSQKYATTCAACHGAQGASVLPLTPSLAGQPSFYAITQLFLFREGRRDNALMSAIANGMSDDDLRGYSDFIGTLPAAALAAVDNAESTPAAPADPQRQARGAALSAKLHCAGCHGADLAGGKQVPRLAGQREDYLLHALRGFREARRVGYTPAMSEALAGVTGAELEDLAHYLATQVSALPPKVAATPHRP